MAALCLLCAVTLGQPPNQTEWLLAPQYLQGMELLYRGKYTEESLVPGVQHNRQYSLETSLFIHDAGPRHWDATLQTAVSLRLPGVGAKSGPGSVRLEPVRISRHGGLHSAKEVSLAIPLAGPPLLETGAFCEFPTGPINMQSYWETVEAGRPVRGWQLVDVEQRGGTACLKLRANQQSVDWNEPRADSTAWRRTDHVWFAPQIGLVIRVERTIEKREPARQSPTLRSTTFYELESRMKYSNKFFTDRKEEIVRFGKFHDEADPLLRQPALYQGQIEALLRRIDYFTKNHPATPFRPAVGHLRQRLDQARQGETPPEVADERPVFKGPVRIGDKVPDFVVSEFTGDKSWRFNDLLGQPILILYYNPISGTGKELLRFAQGLYDRYYPDVVILAMAVSDDSDVIRRQRDALGLAFTILDGRGMHQTFGVDGTPRVILLDAEGVVRYAFTGWGYQTPREVVDEIKNCLRK